jgi:hypothetical protein
MLVYHGIPFYGAGQAYYSYPYLDLKVVGNRFYKRNRDGKESWEEINLKMVGVIARSSEIYSPIEKPVLIATDSGITKI